MMRRALASRKEPIIALAGNPIAAEAARKAARENGWAGGARLTHPKSVEQGFAMVMRGLDAKLRELSEKRIDGLVLVKLILALEQSAIAPLRDRKGQHCRAPSGEYLYRLTKIGCRVSKTQDQLAKELGRTREHVARQIAKLIEIGIVVRAGRGWVELNPALFWRGDLLHRRAYINLSATAEPAEHTPPRVEAEAAGETILSAAHAASEIE